jgi:hypothetical protein
MSVTERLAGSGMLAKSPQRPGVMKMIFVVMAIAFAFTTGMAGDHGDFAGFVMKATLMFLGRGFALFAGGPAVYQSPAYGRSIVVVATQKRARGRSGW